MGSALLHACLNAASALVCALIGFRATDLLGFHANARATGCLVALCLCSGCSGQRRLLHSPVVNCSRYGWINNNNVHVQKKITCVKNFNMCPLLGSKLRVRVLVHLELLGSWVEFIWPLPTLSLIDRSTRNQRALPPGFAYYDQGQGGQRPYGFNPRAQQFQMHQYPQFGPQ